MSFGYLKLSLGIHWGYYLTTLIIMVLFLWKTKKLAKSLLIAYMFLIFSVTVLSRVTSYHIEYDFQLFRLFREAGWWRDKDGVEQVVDNIIMFVPIGILMFLTVKQRSIVWGLGFSVFLEVCQLVFRKGLCEIDDVIANECGVIIGYLMIRVYRLIKIQRKNHV